MDSNKTSSSGANDRVSVGGSGTFDSGVVKCVVCGGVQPGVRELEMHVALDHVNFVPYECVLCRYVRLPTEWAVYAHVKEMHPGSECRVTYKFDESFNRQREVVCDLVRRSLNNTAHSFTRFPLSSSAEQHSYNNNFHSQAHGSALSSPSPTSSTPGRFNQPAVSLANTSAIQQNLQNSSSNKSISSNCGPQTPSYSSSNPTATSAITALLKSTQQQPPTNAQLQSTEATGPCGRCGDAVRLTLPAMNYHVWSRHMPSMRVQCPYCPYGRTTGGQSSVERVQQHCRSQHPNKDDSMIQPDNRPELQSQHRAEMEMCFGIQSQVLSAASEPSSSPLPNGLQQSMASPNVIRVEQPHRPTVSEEISTCHVCGHRINHNSGRVNVNSQQYHVWSRHMNEPCFQCAYCSFTVRSPFDVSRLRSHAIRQHHDLPFKRIDLRNQAMMLRFKHLEKQCYPAPQQGQNSPSVAQSRLFASQPPRFVTHITPGQDLTALFERIPTAGTVPGAVRARPPVERRESVSASNNPHHQPQSEQQETHKCSLCGKSLAGRSRSTREYHVWKHIAKAVLQCRYCAKSYHAPHDSNLMTAHVRSAHPGRPLVYQNKMAMYREKMRQMFTKCFPSPATDSEQPMLCRFCGVHVSDTVGHVKSLHLQPNHSDDDVRRLLDACFANSVDMKVETIDDEQTLFSSTSEISEFGKVASCDTASVDSPTSSTKHQSPANKEIIELE